MKKPVTEKMSLITFEGLWVNTVTTRLLTFLLIRVYLNLPALALKERLKKLSNFQKQKQRAYLTGNGQF